MATTPYPFVANAVLTASQLNSTFNIPVSTKTASYTLVASDAGTRINMNSASATTITVNTSLFSANDNLEITNISTGVCTITAGTATVSTSGTLALAANAGGTLYFISAGVSVFIASGVASSSKIVQVVTTALPTTFSASVAAGAQTAVTGLSVAITPTLNTSKILVMATVTMATTTGANSMYFSLTRGGTPIGIGTAAGSRQAATGGAGVDPDLERTNSGGSIQFIDSPATTSATTYAVTVGHTSGATQTLYVNQTGSDTNANYVYRTISTITVMEILA